MCLTPEPEQLSDPILVSSLLNYLQTSITIFRVFSYNHTSRELSFCFDTIIAKTKDARDNENKRQVKIGDTRCVKFDTLKRFLVFFVRCLVKTTFMFFLYYFHWNQKEMWEFENVIDIYSWLKDRLFWHPNGTCRDSMVCPLAAYVFSFVRFFRIAIWVLRRTYDFGKSSETWFAIYFQTRFFIPWMSSSINCCIREHATILFHITFYLTVFTCFSIS